jgi:hypothetical protein
MLIAAAAFGCAGAPLRVDAGARRARPNVGRTTLAEQALAGPRPTSVHVPKAPADPVGSPSSASYAIDVDGSYHAFATIFEAQELLSVAKKRVSLIDFDALVVQEEGRVVKLTSELRATLDANELTPLAEREFFANIQFDQAVAALRQRVEKAQCSFVAAQLVAIPDVIVALRVAFRTYVKSYGVPDVRYEPEIEHGKRYLRSHCSELTPVIDLTACIERRRVKWVAIYRGWITE